MAVLQRLALRGTPKATKAAARYTPAGGAERCGMCRHYVPSSSCARIEGPVSAEGWCQLYSQQVTWRPRAGQLAGLNPGLVPPGVTLDLNFMVGALDPRVTFTRASTATYFDATGTLRTAAINAPRWDYDPVTHALRGLLIEEARTNVWLQSANAANAAWNSYSVGGPALPAVTGNQTTAPDGTLTAARVVLPAVSTFNQSSILFQLPTTTAQVYAYSMYLRGSVGGEQLYLGITGGGPNYNLRVTLTTAWQLFTLVSPVALAPPSCYFTLGGDLRDPGQSAISAQTIYVWGGQVEAGAFPTSYIPTTAAAVTRAQDIIVLATTGWLNADGTGTYWAEVMTQGNPAGYTRIFGSQAAGVSPVFVNGVNGYGIYDGAIQLLTPNTVPNFSIARPAGRASATVLSVCVAGGPITSGAAGSNFSVLNTNLSLMGDAQPTETTTGYIRRVRYWQRVLSDAEMQQVTT